MVIVDINPIFGKADFTIDDKLAFVLMPFREDLTEIYQTYIKYFYESYSDLESFLYNELV